MPGLISNNFRSKESLSSTILKNVSLQYRLISSLRTHEIMIMLHTVWRIESKGAADVGCPAVVTKSKSNTFA